MIFEVFETLDRRGGASALGDVGSYCWLTASTVLAESASFAFSWLKVPLAASLADLLDTGQYVYTAIDLINRRC
jgi:hypothetical protein